MSKDRECTHCFGLRRAHPDECYCEGYLQPSREYEALHCNCCGRYYLGDGGKLVETAEDNLPVLS